MTSPPDLAIGAGADCRAQVLKVLLASVLEPVIEAVVLADLGLIALNLSATSLAKILLALFILQAPAPEAPRDKCYQ